MGNRTKLMGEQDFTADEGSFGSGELSGDEKDMEEFSLEFDTFPVVLACFIVILNVMVIVMFIRNRSLRTVTNSFLVSLAVSDLLAGLVGIPLAITCTIFRDNNVCPPSVLIWRFISVSTVLHIVLVSVDRYIAIRHAIRYHCIMTRKVFFALTTLAWTSATFVTLIQLSWRQNASMNEDDTDEVNKAQIAYDLTVVVIFFVVPLLVMVFTYAHIFKTVRYHERQIRRYHSPSDTELTPAQNSAQRKTATVFLTMLIVFVVCWLPYFILSLQEQLAHEADLPAWASYVFYHYTRFFTSLSNPLLYVLGKKDFREALNHAFCKKHKSRTESRTSMTTTALYTVEKTSADTPGSELKLYQE